ncbi:MAG: response regulator [Clostridiales bacterium]|nr:response regulator [Clostridiales bacterium]
MNKQALENSIIEYMLSFSHANDSNADTTQQNKCARANQPQNKVELVIKSFVDELPSGFLIYSADEQEKIIYANKALLKIYNCESYSEFLEFTGGSFRGIVHPDDLEQVEQSIIDQINTSEDKIDYVEYRIIRKDGAIRWAEDYGHLTHSKVHGDFYYVFINDATEKVTRRMLETATIINEGKVKQQELQNLIDLYDKERLQRLKVIEGLSVNYDSILYADLDTNTVLPYRLSSRLERQFEQQLQVLDLQWFLDDYVNVWVHPDDRATVAEKTSPDYMRKTLKESDTYYLNYKAVQNGETRFIQLRIVNVGDRENVSQVVIGCRNVDEEIMFEMKQKQLLEVALNNAKLAEIAKNTFLTNMSHDMRTPLNAVFGYLALAKNKISSGEDVLPYLDKIQTAGEQILELIEKVLEMSSRSAQDNAVTESPCNIIELMNETYDAMKGQAEQKNIAFTLNTDSVTHSDVYLDKHKLLQALHHIIGNALKYTDTGGKIDITVKEKASDNSGQFSAYTFEVTDTGVGIKRPLLKRIFDPFFRERDTTSSGIFGTGLGLTISKQLMEAMGGDITAKSKVGKGSTFTISLSLRRQTTQAAEPTDNSDTVKIPEGKKILIVEDNEINLEIEEELLQDLGFLTDSAPDGSVAVEKIKNSKDGEYALILMDIQMPVMDGRTATEEIRKLKNPAHAHIPIIALSANALESDKRESIAVGMNEHLAKPINIPILLDAIRKALPDMK